MDSRGLLFSLTIGETKKYGATPFIHGIFEFQLDRMDSKLARLIESYFEEAYYEAMSIGARGICTNSSGSAILRHNH